MYKEEGQNIIIFRFLFHFINVYIYVVEDKSYKLKYFLSIQRCHSSSELGHKQIEL